MKRKNGKKEKKEKIDRNSLRQGRGTGSSVSLYAIGLLLMFLMPWMVYMQGAGAAWIAIGSFVGMLLVWQMASYRLMRFSLQQKDQVTIPGFLSRRFQESRPILKILLSCSILLLLIPAATMLMYGIADFAKALFGIPKMYTILGVFLISMGLFLLFGRSGLRLAERWIAILVLASLVLIDYAIVRVLGTRHILENIFHSWAAGSVTEYVNVGYMGGRDLSIPEILSLFSFGFLILGNPLVLQRFQLADRARTVHRSRRWAVIFSLFALFLSVLTGGLLRASLYPAKISSIRTLFATILQEDKGRGFLFYLTGVIFVAAAGLMTLELLHACIISASQIVRDNLIPKRHRKVEMSGSNRRALLLPVIVIEVVVASLALCSGDWIYTLCLDAYLVLACGLMPVMYMALRSSRATARGCLVAFLVGTILAGVWEFSPFIPQGNGFITLHELTGVVGILPSMMTGFLLGILGNKSAGQPPQEVVSEFEEVQYRLVSSGSKKERAIR